MCFVIDSVILSLAIIYCSGGLVKQSACFTSYSYVNTYSKKNSKSKSSTISCILCILLVVFYVYF